MLLGAMAVMRPCTAGTLPPVLGVSPLLLSSFLFLSHQLFAFFPSSFIHWIPGIIDFKRVWVLHACIFHFSAFILKLKYMWHPREGERWFSDCGVETERRNSILPHPWQNELWGYRTQRWVYCLLVLVPHGNQLLRKHLNLKTMCGVCSAGLYF